MKAWLKITLSVISVSLSAAIVWVIIFVTNGQKVGGFDVSEQLWQECIEEFPYDAQFSRVRNRKDAVNIADNVLKERFPQINLFEFYPYNVDYDKTNDCWLVVGRQPLCDNVKRAEPYVIIDGDGSVLAVLMWG